MSDDVFDRALDRRNALIKKQRRRIKALEEALTPNGATKAAYIGEFRQAMNDRSRRDADICGEVAVEWTTIKEIMQAIRDHADALLKEADQ